ncbi:MAG: hypothetical protein H6721_20570 [Sandaracinus sp.]|nr:hypothetical protein [Sandaracinus sp.]MCB9622291.1 hypothetical protein [Sandaracinus sp.]MCB9634525.1 hypothetical protein [Sandaracinus sp.]
MKCPRFVCLLLALSLACGGDDDGSLDGSTGGGDSGGRRDAGPPSPPNPCRIALPVDLVFVVDNSHSMQEEQASLIANFPLLIETLTTPSDRDGDGVDDPGVSDLRVAIVTTDMGVGVGNTSEFCPSADGDDGRFVYEARSAEAACAGFVVPEGGRWLELDPADPDALARGFSCLAELGTNGCGLEQQLEASLASITRHAGEGEANAGFLRSDSLIAFVFVTDEDDCSAADPSIFDPSPAARTALGPLGTRCAFHPDRLHPISRYVTAFKNLALDREGDVLVAAITGVPRSYTTDPLNVDYDALLADPAMTPVEDELNPGQLAPACSFGGVGSAPPARRIVQVVEEFAQTGDGLLASICQADLRPAVESIAELVAGRICPAPE